MDSVITYCGAFLKDFCRERSGSGSKLGFQSGHTLSMSAGKFHTYATSDLEGILL